MAAKAEDQSTTVVSRAKKRRAGIGWNISIFYAYRLQGMLSPLEQYVLSAVKTWEKVVAGLAIVGLVGFAVFAGYENHAQRVADKMAEEYAARVSPLVAADPRFKDVLVYRFSGFGCARVHGWVATETDLEALHRFIEGTSPPKNIRMMWTVEIDANPDPRLKEGYPFPATTSPG
jgi:hypothetical protein